MFVNFLLADLPVKGLSCEVSTMS